MLNSDSMRRQSFRRPPQNDRRPLANAPSSPTLAQQQAPVETNTGKPKSSKSKKVVLLAVLAGVLVVVSIALAGFFAWKYFSDDSSNEEQAAAETTKKVVDKAGILFDLPQDEDPTVAQIQDKSKLEDQDFFDKAKDGDYLLVYEKAKLALIYRESANKLINVGPINVPEQGETPESSQGSVSGESTP